MSDLHLQIILGAITLLGVILTSVVGVITAYFQSKMKKEVSQVNDAVNHRHEKGEGALKLYDLVWENHKRASELIEWKRTYDKGPLDDGHKVELFVHETNKRLEDLQKDVKEIKENCPEGGRLPCHYLLAKSKDETKTKSSEGFGHSMES